MSLGYYPERAATTTTTTAAVWLSFSTYLNVVQMAAASKTECD